MSALRVNLMPPNDSQSRAKPHGKLAAATANSVISYRTKQKRQAWSWASGTTLTSFPLLIIASLIAALCALHASEARYIHSTYRFSPNDLADDPSGNPFPPEMSRRQDFESDDDDEDQKAAASYRNQDDNGGESAGNDNYGDNESDGPYEESPVEQEGQADLERFFDDHLGASDRDGMDKENLPSNLVTLLSDPPRAPIPLSDDRAAPSKSPQSLTVMPLAPVTNPVVQPSMSPPRHLNTSPAASERENKLESLEPLSSLPTIQTSFIRLPDEKMIITHQVTAHNPSRNTPTSSSNAPARSQAPPPPRPLKILPDDEETPSGSEAADANQVPQSSPQTTPLANDDWSQSPLLDENQHGQLKISPTEALTNTPPAEEPKPVNNDDVGGPVSSSSDVVATEDEDLDRVYVTNETSRPFRIEALGGFDPEEDFIDAAKELEVVASDEFPKMAPLGANNTNRSSFADPSNGDLDLGDSVSKESYNGEQRVPRQEISFHDLDTDKMFEDASETDEVTFGQDDPYQTDLEAEMRQQEYDRPSSVSKKQISPEPTNTNAGLNVVVDNGTPGSLAEASADNSGQDNTDDEELDNDLDNEYRAEPNARQKESMAAAATKSRFAGRTRNDIDDEGGWVNDGVDEMDIPSQSHQNSVLEKAELQEEAAAKKAAAEEKAAEAAAASKQDPDNSATENGQTNDNADESNMQMPNADYLKNDFVEDDSGYAS